MKWLARDEWRELFAEVLDEHLTPACDSTGVDSDEIIAILERDWFMTTVWGCAFEDFLTRDYEGRNIVDDYLKRRGWKESASTRGYMSALRTSVISLYEVSDINRDLSFRARDLVRGGEPVLISERSATHSLEQWDRIATRVMRVGSRTIISGAILPFEREASEEVLQLIRRVTKRAAKEKHKLASMVGCDVNDAVIVNAYSEVKLLRTVASAITTIWLVNIIRRSTDSQLPKVCNAEGDELMFCTVHFPFAGNSTAADIRSALGRCPELRQENATFWNWIEIHKQWDLSIANKQSSQRQFQFHTTTNNGSLILGTVEIKQKAVLLSVNSRARCERGKLLLAETLGTLVAQPLVEMQTLEKLMEQPNSTPPPNLDLSDEERRTIIHDSLSRHYRSMLDQPIPMLGNKSPRAAATTAKGRVKVSDWLKMLENHSAKLTGRNDPMATYDFSWLWTELGVQELRQ